MTNRATSGYTLIADSNIAFASSGLLLVTVMVIILESDTACAEILPLTASTPRSSSIASVKRVLLKI